MTIEARIRELFKEVLTASGQSLRAQLTADSILLDTGLDSLGFAILVARLEEDLGYDPFVKLAEPVYPRTFGEFLEIYERFKPTDL